MKTFWFINFHIKLDQVQNHCVLGLMIKMDKELKGIKDGVFFGKKY